MAKEQHLRILKRGVVAWNQWRRENPAISPDLNDVELMGADLHGYNLSNVEFIGANLSRAILSEANLTGANLMRTDLRCANLSDANLEGADLHGANLGKANLARAILTTANLTAAHFVGADLSQADLMDADLDAADFREANFSGTEIGYNTFAHIDLRTIKAIETVKHAGPSTIGIDTIYESKGKIPEVFLRGAGVPANFIEYMSSLVGTAFEYYSCFISYSGEDQEFASRIHADLQDIGVRCWFAPQKIQAGRKLHEQIDAAIRLHEKLLLILSPNSINSEWVKTEIAKARKREIKEGKRVLFPIRLNITFVQLQEWECFDADRGKDSAREIREYYIPDFTHWKHHDKYEEEFKKLLRDLKKEMAIAAGSSSQGTQ